MSDVIIPKPGALYNDYICQGSDNNYYVKIDGVWQKVEGGSENFINIDCSQNPQCPIAKKGDKFIVTASGKFGGRIGPDVNVGDMIICHADNDQVRSWDGGDIDSSFVIVEKNLGSIQRLMENTPITRLTTPYEININGRLTANSIVSYGYLQGMFIAATNYFARKIKINIEIPSSGYQMDEHYEFIHIIRTEEEELPLTLFSLQNMYGGHGIYTVIKNASNYAIKVRGYWLLNDTIDGQEFVIMQPHSTLKLFGISNGNYIPGNWYSYD